jgi:protein-disulfide isomerase
MRVWSFALAGIACSTAAQATPVTPPADDAPLEVARLYFTEDPDAPMIAPKGYDVTIVEYMDYQCPSCRTSHGPLKQLVAKDKKVRVIFRDWPIFGPASEYAARIALASKYQAKYHAVQEALYNAPRPLSEEKIDAAVKKAGVDWDRLQAERKAHAQDVEELLALNDHQANDLGLQGTPGFLIGNSQSFGGLTLAQFEESVAEARKKVAAK